MGAADEISLRPLSLRPGAGVNPFASFALGAGLGLKNKVTAVAQGNEKRKSRGEVVKYTHDFLMKFAEAYSRLPTELQFSNLEIVLDPNDPDREAQRAVLKSAGADDNDERDWRARAPAPTADQQQQQPPREPTPIDPNAPKIQRATDLGRTAWAAGHTSDGADQALRKVKGILNKLTPEKFERLQGQLIPLVSSYEVLEGTIRMVFENAVAQPTFVAMYADLCAELDAVLPEFAGARGEQQTFKKMLANTCQEEYEATEAARAAAAEQTGDKRDDLERKAKQRMLGNVRLIAELFKKSMVNDRIMLLILSDLLGPSDSDPSEDSLEAACELVAIAGAALEANPRSKTRLDATFQHLTRLSNNSKAYASRIRFVVRDVIDLRSQHWVARRETFTAKKLEDIRTEAQAELGIMDIEIPGLTPLGPGMEPLPGIASKRAEDVELFPAFRGSQQLNTNATGDAAADGKFTSLLGEFVPLDSNATPPEAPGQAPRAPRTDLSDDERVSLGKSLFTDFMSSGDVTEAVAAAQELVVPGFGRSLVRIGIEKAFDALNEIEQSAIVGLIITLAAAESAVTPADVRAAVEEFCGPLEDISLDIPSAPRVLGRILGLMASRDLMGLDVVAAQAGNIEGAEPRRGFVAAALLAVKGAAGEPRMLELVKDGQVDVPKLFEHDAEFEGHLSGAQEFAKEQGLSAVM